MPSGKKRNQKYYLVKLNQMINKRAAMKLSMSKDEYREASKEVTDIIGRVKHQIRRIRDRYKLMSDIRYLTMLYFEVDPIENKGLIKCIYCKYAIEKGGIGSGDLANYLNLAVASSAAKCRRKVITVYKDKGISTYRAFCDYVISELGEHPSLKSDYNYTPINKTELI